MAGHLFFQGAMRIGKSTVLRNELNRRGNDHYGFAVQRLYEQEQILGYQASVICQQLLPVVDTPYQADLPGVFILNGNKDILVLEQVIKKLSKLIAERQPRFIFLDEIGGIELCSNMCQDILLQILGMDIPCIGIIKSSANLLHTTSSFQLQDEVSDRAQRLVSAIRTKGQIVTVDEYHLTKMVGEIQQFFKDLK